jgi:hypothetical protein
VGVYAKRFLIDIDRNGSAFLRRNLKFPAPSPYEAQKWPSLSRLEYPTPGKSHSVDKRRGNLHRLF